MGRQSAPCILASRDLHESNASSDSVFPFYTHASCSNPVTHPKQELYGAHTPCAASQWHAARQLLICFVYENIAGSEGLCSFIIVIFQPLCVFYLLPIRDTFD